MPAGRPKGSKKNPFADMLRISINESKGNVKKLRLIADQLVKQAMDGEAWAIKEVADRLDGKPAQALVGEEGDGPIQVTVKWLKDEESQP